MEKPVDLIQEVINDKRVWENGEKYIENAMWFKENSEDVKQKHKGQVIVVQDKEVIFSSEKPEEVRKKLRSFNQIQRIQSYIFYIPREGEMALW